MEGSPYQKFSIFWNGARFQGPNSGFLLAGTWTVPLSGTRGSGSCLEAEGNDTGIFSPNSLPLISQFRHRSRGITCALKSTGVAFSQQAPLRQDAVPLILISWVPLKPELILNPDPFSSPVASFREVSETDSEAIPMAPLKQRGSLVLDDGPRSEIQEGGLKVIRRKYGIHSSVQMRSSLEFERAPDGGPGEIAIFEALVMAIPWLKSLREAPGVITPLGTIGPVDVSRPVSFFGEEVAKKMLAIPRRFRGNLVLVGPHIFTFSVNIARLPASVLYDEYQQAGTRRRRPFYAPPPRLNTATPPAARIRPLLSRTAIGDAPLMGVWQRLLTELFLLRNREWLEGRTERWDPEEEYRRHLLCSEGSDHHFGGCPQVGEATTGACWDFAFYRSEACHYRVPVLHAAFCRKPLSGLEGAGVGENPSARLCYFPRLEK
ncbi:hypothetical protein F2Q69_00022440 [Brassica cretica]|uniref:Uncharacterized protein n=1 Tax=Brassica cretica TaxID=69181 RepID=A0A8S9QR58_BRACR|nr:hypothetical protein F2Q69_00022440 [Brassica cretica]